MSPASIFMDYIMSPLGIFLILWVLSFALMLAIGRPLIHWLKFRKGMKWAPREDTPDTHLQKAGVPSMGGIGIIGAAFVGWLAFLAFSTSASFAFGRGSSDTLMSFVIISVFPLIVMSHAILGYLDDHSKATNKGGLSSKSKLLGQIILAALFLGTLSFFAVSTNTAPSRFHAYPPDALLQLKSVLFDSWIYILAAFLLIIGTSNAVNLTDGIDGLAAGLSVQVGVVFTLLWLEFSQISDNIDQFPTLFTYSTPLFWIPIGGACLGFLAFNKYPAKVFMGDTGSLALGAALGAGAILTRTVWLLPFVGFIFYIEMFSVIVQVLYFKYTRKKFGEGKRLFRRAPLHHHFELGGWSEWRVVATFWGVNLVTTIIGLVLWKMGILPRFP